MKRRSIVRWLTGALFVLAFFAFAPVRLGGSMHYLTIHGTSMEPKIHAGDVVVVRGQRTYGVGDVITYVSDMGGAVVLHRVIGMVDGRYIMRGDNNNFDDRYQPSVDEVVGRKVVLIPRGATVIRFLAERRVLIVAVVGALCLLAAAAGSGRGRRGVRRRLGSIA